MGKQLEVYDRIGVFQIFSAMEQAHEKCLDVCGASREEGQGIILFENNRQWNQRFVLRYVGDGYYVLQIFGSQMVVSVANGSDIVCQMTYEETDNQLWSIEEVNSDQFRFVNKQTDKVLDVEGARTEDRTRVIAWEKNQGLNQAFWLKLVEW